MKWTYDWLCDYLKTNNTPVEIADTLTRIGLEVEDLQAPIAPIAAKIVECRSHENSDHLHVLMVDDGGAELRQVVCGAPNARVGLVSALAVPGCVIDGHEIAAGKLRGVVSNGMMCSARELGIGDDHSGIIELPADTKIGSPVMDAPVVFDAGITPNRPDYLSVRGIAMDLAASGAGTIAPQKDIPELKPVKGSRTVNIKTDKCRAYAMCEIDGINVAPSDNKIASRLRAIGINPKNAPVDATNYICYDMGQPMHCFDADEIDGDITVRMAENGENFTDLFGNEHTLCDADIVVTDASGVLALAGVIGGMRGMTTDKTRNVILESAYFDPVCVRKTSKRIGVSTDASYRYERGIDPTMSHDALAYASQIITAQCGGKITGVVYAGTIASPDVKIHYSPDMFMKKTGADMDTQTQKKILTALGYEICADGDKWTLTPRAARVDVMIPETVVADLLRIYGYEKIASANKHTVGNARAHDNHEYDIKCELAARGLNESKSFGFGNSVTEELISDAAPIKIANPITADLDVARRTLLGNLLIAVGNNEKRGYPDLNMFELGTVFDGDMPGMQHTALCIVRTGATAPRHWTRRNRDVDIYDVKADLISLMHGQRFTVATDNPPRWAHPFRYGAIFQGKKKIAEFGELSPVVAKKMRIKTNVVVAIVDDIANLPARKRGHVGALSEFQPITRDFAFVVDSDFPAEKIIASARGADSRITNVVVFDAFDMGNNQKSIAFTITIQPDKNMTDADLMAIQTAVIAAVEKKCGGKIRDK